MPEWQVTGREATRTLSTEKGRERQTRFPSNTPTATPTLHLVDSTLPCLLSGERGYYHDTITPPERSYASLQTHPSRTQSRIAYQVRRHPIERHRQRRIRCYSTDILVKVLRISHFLQYQQTCRTKHPEIEIVTILFPHFLSLLLHFEALIQLSLTAVWTSFFLL